MEEGAGIWVGRWEAILDGARREWKEEAGISLERLWLLREASLDEALTGTRYLLALCDPPEADAGEPDSKEKEWKPQWEDPEDKDPVVKCQWTPVKDAFKGQVKEGRGQLLREAVEWLQKEYHAETGGDWLQASEEGEEGKATEKEPEATEVERTAKELFGEKASRKVGILQQDFIPTVDSGTGKPIPSSSLGKPRAAEEAAAKATRATQKLEMEEAANKTQKATRKVEAEEAAAKVTRATQKLEMEEAAAKTQKAIRKVEAEEAAAKVTKTTQKLDMEEAAAKAQKARQGTVEEGQDQGGPKRMKGEEKQDSQKSQHSWSAARGEGGGDSGRKPPAHESTKGKAGGGTQRGEEKHEGGGKGKGSKGKTKQENKGKGKGRGRQQRRAKKGSMNWPEDNVRFLADRKEYEEA